MKIFAVIPACNEEKTICEVVEKTKKFVDRVIVVDDGSVDSTASLASKVGATVLKHRINLGVGAALKTGFIYSRERCDAIVTLDADAQHNPEEIPKLLKALNDSEIVLGSRDFRCMPFHKKIGNYIINLLSFLLFGIRLSDTQTGFRAIKVRAYDTIEWKSRDYSALLEMLVNAKKRKVKVKEVKVSTIYNDIYKGTTLVDGVKILINMLCWRLIR